MKVGHVTERTADIQGTSILDSDEMDRSGIDLGATGRLQLMAKLAEGRCLCLLTRFVSWIYQPDTEGQSVIIMSGC